MESSRYEQAIIHSRSIDPDIKDRFCKTLQTARLSNPQEEPRHQVIWDTATTVIGPAFFFFTRWVMRMAQEKNIQRLYFLSRDGEIFYRIAQLIEEKSPFGLEHRYLYGSRHSWLISCMDKIGPEELQWIFSDWWYVLTVRSVCQRAGIEPEDIKDFLIAQDFPVTSWETKLSSTEKKRLQHGFESVFLQKRILDHCAMKFQNTLDYLLQKGLGEKASYAIVDIGWRGKPQAALHKILARGKILPSTGLYGFYFGITEGKEIYQGDQMTGFLFDLSRSLTRFHLRNNHLFEAFAASSEGKIKGFVRQGGHYAPIMDEQSAQAALQWGVNLQQEGILAFCRELLKSDLDSRLSICEIYEILDATLSMFIERPSVAEAEVYGHFPLDGEMTQSRIQPIAPLVSRKKFWALCLNLKSFNLFWVQASLIRSGLKPEKFLWRFVLPLIEVIFYSMQLFSGKATKILHEE